MLAVPSAIDLAPAGRLQHGVHARGTRSWAAGYTLNGTTLSLGTYKARDAAQRAFDVADAAMRGPMASLAADPCTAEELVAAVTTLGQPMHPDTLAQLLDQQLQAQQPAPSPAPGGPPAPRGGGDAPVTPEQRAANAHQHKQEACCTAGDEAAPTAVTSLFGQLTGTLPSWSQPPTSLGSQQQQGRTPPTAERAPEAPMPDLPAASAPAAPQLPAPGGPTASSPPGKRPLGAADALQQPPPQRQRQGEPGASALARGSGQGAAGGSAEGAASPQRSYGHQQPATGAMDVEASARNDHHGGGAPEQAAAAAAAAAAADLLSADQAPPCRVPQPGAQAHDSAPAASPGAQLLPEPQQAAAPQPPAAAVSGGAAAAAAAPPGVGAAAATAFLGVYFNPKHGWRARANMGPGLNGPCGVIYIATAATPEAAAQARDRVRIARVGWNKAAAGNLNFPIATYAGEAIPDLSGGT